MRRGAPPPSACGTGAPPLLAARRSALPPLAPRRRVLRAAGRPAWVAARRSQHGGPRQPRERGEELRLGHDAAHVPAARRAAWRGAPRRVGHTRARSPSPALCDARGAAPLPRAAFAARLSAAPVKVDEEVLHLDAVLVHVREHALPHVLRVQAHPCRDAAAPEKPPPPTNQQALLLRPVRTLSLFSRRLRYALELAEETAAQAWRQRGSTAFEDPAVRTLASSLGAPLSPAPGSSAAPPPSSCVAQRAASARARPAPPPLPREPAAATRAQPAPAA